MPRSPKLARTVLANLFNTFASLTIHCPSI
jgi:hypothetical protein